MLLRLPEETTESFAIINNRQWVRYFHWNRGQNLLVFHFSFLSPTFPYLHMHRTNLRTHCCPLQENMPSESLWTPQMHTYTHMRKHACSHLMSSRWLDITFNHHQFELATKKPWSPQSHYWLSQQESSGCFFTASEPRATASARRWKLERPSSPLHSLVRVPSPFRTPHICARLLPETSYLHAAGNGGRKFSGRWRWYGEWISRYTEREDDEQSEKKWTWLLQGSSVLTEQCGGGCSVWVHICGVCGVLIDFLQICLEVAMCALCLRHVAYSIISPSTSVCVCVYVRAHKCARFQLQQISWTSSWPLIAAASLPGFIHMTLCTRDGVKWEMGRRDDRNRGQTV